jgi:hypothetical protein
MLLSNASHLHVKHDPEVMDVEQHNVFVWHVWPNAHIHKYCKVASELAPATWAEQAPTRQMKSLVPKRYKSIFVYSRKMQSKSEIYCEMH